MKKYFVLKDGLKYNGKEYRRGEQLNHKLGIRDQQILNTMVKLRRISTEPMVTTESEPVPMPMVTTESEPVPMPMVTTESEPVPMPVAPPEPVPAPPEQTVSTEAKIVHKGGGYYEVVKNNIVISDGVTLKGEEAAKKFVDEL